MATKPNYTVANENGIPTLRLYDEIGGEFAGLISDEQIVATLDELKGAPAINVRINSPGGDVFVAHSIYNALRRHGAKITTIVDALAASAASVIMCAGDTIEMAENSTCMIHNAWTMTAGNEADHRKTADTLAKQDQIICDLYVARSGQTPEAIKQLMDAESWLTPGECKALGLCDSITQPLNVKPPTFAANRFRNTPQRFKIAASVPQDESKPSGYVNTLALQAEIKRRQLGL